MDESVRRLAERLLNVGYDDLPDRERRVIRQIARRVHVSKNINQEFHDARTLGQRLADRVAKFGGSWSFIMLCSAALAIWTLSNSLFLGKEAFDPYPYVFLNLILSMLAALQAPIIMMSQNRQAAKDRLAAANDYEVNLKAELEIMALHEKLDHIRNEQLTALLQSQSSEIEMLTKTLHAVTSDTSG